MLVQARALYIGDEGVNMKEDLNQLDAIAGVRNIKGH